MNESTAEVIDMNADWKSKKAAQKAAKQAEREAKLAAKEQAVKKAMALNRQARREALIAQGIPEEQVAQVINQQDFEALPMQQQILLMARNFDATVGELIKNIQNLHFNDAELANSMDSNFAIMAKCLTKAGVPFEVQKEIAEEIKAAHAAAEAQRKLEAQAKLDTDEKAVIETAGAQDRIVSTEGQDGPPEFPEGAQVFGGNS